MRSAAALLTLAPSLAIGQELSATAPISTSARSAFQAFANGRPQEAYRQAVRIVQTRRSADLGDAHWVAGLSAWRLGKFDDAATHFAARARIAEGVTAHRRAAAAFWVARSHLYGRKPELVDVWLGRAAVHHGTLYGAIAARQLAKSLAQRPWPALHFPRLRPNGGWKLDRALIFAIMRRESAFDRTAVSSAGAVGLMQVMPETATALVGDARYRGNGYRLLYDAGTNTALGQHFLELLLGPGHFKGNIVLAIAAYNAGPKAVAAWSYQDDPLSFIEAIPLEETRQYVPRVLIDLWSYRRQLKQPAASLDALASNEWPIYMAADLVDAESSGGFRRSKRRIRYRGE